MVNVNNGAEQRPQRWLITTSIPYVNAQPHIGHALEMVQTDVLARYHRLRGDRVRFQSGADENALKNVQAAEKEGISTQQLVERNAARFAALCDQLDLSWDDFIRTSSEARHWDGVEKLWRACLANGDIYKQRYQGLYCVGCEQFYTAEELVNGLCPIHHQAPELVEEENYFFRLARYQAQLATLIETDQLRIVPETRKNEVLSFIRRGLRDFSISRDSRRARGWGIPVPDDPSQVVYVWFDALINYITGPGYAYDAPDYREFWCEGDQRLHLIGKDIIRFHAIYWPAMLLSAGLRLPDFIGVHGFLTVDGEKISKSRGNVIDPVALVEQLGADAVRYYLLRKVPTTSDANFTHAEFVQSYNAELADQLGNLLNRVVRLIERYAAGHIPPPGPLTAVEEPLISALAAAPGLIEAAMTDFVLHKALTILWEIIAAANKYVVEVEPWVLARQWRETGDAQERSRLDTSLYVLAEALRLIALHLAPFLPETAVRILQQIGVQPEECISCDNSLLQKGASQIRGNGQAPMGLVGASPHLWYAPLQKDDWRDAVTWGKITIGAPVQPAAVLFQKT
ncbi:MAG: methionine--tRNA ligase [Caldilineaceae bacterium]